jgi:hypothetical protein
MSMTSRAARRRASAEGASAGILDVGLVKILVVHDLDAELQVLVISEVHVFVLMFTGTGPQVGVDVVRAGTLGRGLGSDVFNFPV